MYFFSPGVAYCCFYCLEGTKQKSSILAIKKYVSSVNSEFTTARTANQVCCNNFFLMNLNLTKSYKYKNNRRQKRNIKNLIVN